MKRIVLISILFLSFSIVKAQSKDVLRFIEEYQSIAHQNINGNMMGIEKWEETGTLAYKIEGDLVHMSRKSLKKYLAEIEGLTGITFSETVNISVADIVMYSGDLKDYLRLTNTNVLNNITSKYDNWNDRKYNANRQLTSASFCVDPKKTKTPDRYRFLFKKGILKSIGLWGRSDDEYSIFYKYNTKYNLRLNKNDKRIIKLHYNSNIKAGMSLSELKETILQDIDVEAMLKQKL